MSESVREDPFSVIARVDEQQFELRSEAGLIIPLSFEPGPDYILRSIMATPGAVAPSAICRTRGYRNACDLQPGPHYDDRARVQCANELSNLVFTFTALRSTFIQPRGKWETRKIFGRNPDYTVLDEIASS
jgi:hypothetical protein